MGQCVLQSGREGSAINVAVSVNRDVFLTGIDPCAHKSVVF